MFRDNNKIAEAFDGCVEHHSGGVIQKQTAETGHFTSMELLLFVFCTASHKWWTQSIQEMCLLNLG